MPPIGGVKGGCVGKGREKGKTRPNSKRRVDGVFAPLGGTLTLPIRCSILRLRHGRNKQIKKPMGMDRHAIGMHTQTTVEPNKLLCNNPSTGIEKTKWVTREGRWRTKGGGALQQRLTNHPRQGLVKSIFVRYLHCTIRTRMAY